MQGAQRPPQRLDRCHDFAVLTVTPSVKIAERDDLDQIVQGHGFLSAGFTDLAVKFATKRHVLFAQPFLLVIASSVEIRAVWRARNPDDAVFAAAWTTDHAQSRTWPLPFALLAIGAVAHFFPAPSAGFGGGGTNP
jgi:hypothetical protein